MTAASQALLRRCAYSCWWMTACFRWVATADPYTSIQWAYVTHHSIEPPLVCSFLIPARLYTSQVHPQGLRHVRADRRVNEWRAPGRQTIKAAASNERQVRSHARMLLAGNSSPCLHGALVKALFQLLHGRSIAICCWLHTPSIMLKVLRALQSHAGDPGPGEWRDHLL